MHKLLILDADMTQDIYIERKLWYTSPEGQKELSQSDLYQQKCPLVILGEAGMGKSYLLNHLAEKNEAYVFYTARQLLIQSKEHLLQALTGKTTLVIDALDEVAAGNDGDAIDQVLKKLDELNYPLFIFSCRVAEWSSAINKQAIQGQYEKAPLELHLLPFSDKDAMDFLSVSIGCEKAKTVVEHYQTLGLDAILGNPQTLELIINSAEKSDLPNTRAELFEDAVNNLRKEHRNEKPKNRPEKELALDAAGAAFASLILTGNDSIARVAEVNEREGDLPLIEVNALPDAENISIMLNTRLFKANGVERFTYWHRLIGEYLGARWLAKCAKTKRQRRRLLSLFHRHGAVVPASLRGIHAWLAQDAELMPSVIRADPVGLIEYGNADSLTLTQARLLLNELIQRSHSDPRFLSHWNSYSIRGILHQELIMQIEHLMSDKQTSFLLRCLLIQTIKNSSYASKFKENFYEILMDNADVFAVRSDACETLAALPGQDWENIVYKLWQCGNEDSLRLAQELLRHLDYKEVSEALVADIMLAYVTVEGRSVGAFFYLRYYYPHNRISSLLDKLAERIESSDSHLKQCFEYSQLSGCVYHLLGRKILAGDKLLPSQFLHWLKVFNSSYSVNIENQAILDQYIRNNDALRQSIQRIAILEAPRELMRAHAYDLKSLSASFAPNDVDIIALLKTLAPDERTVCNLKGLVGLIYHDVQKGAEVREFAKTLSSDPAFLSWLDEFIKPKQPDEWEREQIKREKQEKEKRKKNIQKTRESYIPHIEKIKQGDWAVLHDPALAYLNYFSDLEREFPPHERLISWLGAELSAAVFDGLEAFLKSGVSTPTATDIVTDFIDGKNWNAAWVIVAALAERFRESECFDDLSDELMMAGLFHSWVNSVEKSAEMEGFEKAIEDELKKRGLWLLVMRRYCEPQLNAGLKQTYKLYDFMRDDLGNDEVTQLALEWLEKFPHALIADQQKMLHRVLYSGKTNALSLIVRQRLTHSCQDKALKQLWSAVGLIADFQKAQQWLLEGYIESELIWSLRDLSYERLENGHLIELSVEQKEWIITNFRVLWPYEEHPTGVSGGRKNKWDATEYLVYLIQSLGSLIDDKARAALEGLKAQVEDDYTRIIKQVLAEQAKKQVEAVYQPCSLAEIKAIVYDEPPATVADLQMFMLDALSVVQQQIKSDDVDSWRGFYDDKLIPFAEERCRDYLLLLLRPEATGVLLEPETHVARDKEVDIACSVGQKIRLPIEVKGQWHPDLWHAADTQLSDGYAQDWRADKRGIYLVLWFGNKVKGEHKKLRSSGKGLTKPDTPEELKNMLEDQCKAFKDGDIKIFVLDIAIDAARG